MCLLLEVLDLFGNDARTGRQHEMVVAQELAVVEFDRVRLLVDRLACPTTSCTRWSSSERSGRCSFSARSWPNVMYMKPGW